MPTYDFWYCEEELLNTYVKAYYDKTKYEAWLFGYYNYVAQVTALSNMFKDMNSEVVDYPDFISNEQTNIKIMNTPKNNNDYEFLSQYY